MNLSFADAVIHQLPGLHISELVKIKYAIEALLTKPENILAEAKKIRDEASTLQAIQFLRTAGRSEDVATLNKLVRSL